MGALGRIKDTRAVEPLVVLLQDEDTRVRYRAAEALCQLGDLRGIPILIQGFREDMSADRFIEILSEMRGPRVVELLVAALESDSPYVRYGAAEALAEMGNAESVPPLLSTLRDKFPEVAAAAASALARLKDDNTLALLQDALNDQNDAVRSLAAQSLGQIGDTAAIEALISALGDEYPGVRHSAGCALSRITDTDFGNNRRLWQKWWEENEPDLR